MDHQNTDGGTSGSGILVQNEESKAYKQDNQHNILDHQNTVGGVPGSDILVQKEIDPEVPQMETETDRACVPKQIGMFRIPVERLSTDQKLNMALDDIVKQTNKSTLKHHNARSGSTSSYHSALKDSCSRSCHTPSKGGTYSKTPESKGSPLSGHRRSPKSFTPSGLNLFRKIASPILQKDHGEIIPQVAVYKRKLENRVSDVVPCTDNMKVMQFEHSNTKRRTILPTSNESAHDILGESSEKTLDDESLIKCSVDKDLHKREQLIKKTNRSLLFSTNEKAGVEGLEKNVHEASVVESGINLKGTDMVTVTVEKRSMARTFFKIADKIAKIAEESGVHIRFTGECGADLVSLHFMGTVI